MKYCTHCDIHITTISERCPLCGGLLDMRGEIAPPAYPRLHRAPDIRHRPRVTETLLWDVSLHTLAWA